MLASVFAYLFAFSFSQILNFIYWTILTFFLTYSEWSGTKKQLGRQLCGYQTSNRMLRTVFKLLGKATDFFVQKGFSEGFFSTCLIAKLL